MCSPGVSAVGLVPREDLFLRVNGPSHNLACYVDAASSAYAQENFKTARLELRANSSTNPVVLAEGNVLETQVDPFVFEQVEPGSPALFGGLKGHFEPLRNDSFYVPPYPAQALPYMTYTFEPTAPGVTEVSCLLDDDQICSSQTLRVGWEPLPVQDLRCVSDNLDSLVCLWKKPWNPIETSYSSSFKIEEGDVAQSCEGFPAPPGRLYGVQGLQYCYLDSSTRPQFMEGTYQRFYSLQILGQNKLLPQGKIWKHQVDLYAVLRLGQIESLNLIPMSTFINVSYKIPHKIFQLPDNLRLREFIEISDGSETMRREAEEGSWVGKGAMGRTSFKLNDLNPNTEYTIKVSIKVDHENACHWSKPAEAKEKTQRRRRKRLVKQCGKKSLKNRNCIKMFDTEKMRTRVQLSKKNKRQFVSFCKKLRLKRHYQQMFCRKLRKKRSYHISKTTPKYFRMKDSENKRLWRRLKKKNENKTQRDKSERRPRIKKIFKKIRKTVRRRGRQNKQERRELLCLEPVAQHCVKNCGKTGFLSQILKPKYSLVSLLVLSITTIF